MARELSVRTFLAALAAGLGLAAPAPAEDPPRRPSDDFLIQTRRFNEVAIQKIELEVRDGLLAATKLVGTDPAKAIERLQQVKKSLDADTVLVSTRRDALLKQVDERVREAETKQKQLAERAADRDNRAATKSKLQLTTERYAADQAELRRALDRIAALEKIGKTAEAQHAVDELLKKYPAEPVAIALTQSGSMASRIADAKDLLAEQDKRILLAMRDVDKSALPPVGDIEFPKDWKERTKGRKAELSKEEKAILEALAKPVSIKAKDSAFGDVMSFLSDSIGLTITLDKSDLADAQVTSDTPVTIQTPAKGMQARTVLRSLLGQLGLSYVVQGGEIRVVSQTKARELMTTKVYPIGDLVQGVGAFGNSVRWGPYNSQAQAQENAQAIVDTIEKQLAPDSWRSRGGEGSVTFHYPSMSLIVRQSAEVHMMLKGGSR
jgi:hypothetical protein